MNDTNEVELDPTAPIEVDEKLSLQYRLKQMGVSFHPATGVDKLKVLLAKALAPPVPKEKADALAPVAEAPLSEAVIAARKRKELRLESAKLVRIVVSCQNPAKADQKSEIFHTGNKFIGMFKRVVPFDVAEGWHVEKIIYDMIKARKCQKFHTVVNRDGSKTRKGKLINEFVVEVLPDLSRKDLDKLALQQAMAHSIED
jgi:hypothetical protein